ncbi:MAG: hypothetical protein ABI540_00240 [Spartobacteria bacterium]
MSPEDQNLEPEIAHILSIDVVDYSKLLVSEEIELLNQLKRIVRETKCSCAAEASGRLIRIPTGDGMVLLFFHSPEEPLQCAVEITEALQSHPEIKVRMGAHSGPVTMIEDVNDRLNVAGAGMNIAQRVLDCGDAGHILLSKRLANDLAEYSHWRPHLYDMGECVVKHGVKLRLVNFHRDSIGNPARPQRLQQDEASAGREVKAAASRRRYFWFGGLMLVLLTAAVMGFFLLRWVGDGRSTAERKGLAVLPFENWSDDSEESYFAEGVQGEILTRLSKVAALKVISRASVIKYGNVKNLDLKKVAEELQVRYFLHGSVQRAEGQVRVNAQLVDGLTGAQLWADRFDRKVADVFKIQTEIAESIVLQLEARLTPEEKVAIEYRPTNDLVAYELYLKAKAIIERVAYQSSRTEDLAGAGQLLEEATSRDPSFYLAYCQLANAYDQIYFYGNDHSPRRFALSEAAVDAAKRLRPDAGETHLAAANHYYFSRDYDQARKELALARRKLPNDAIPIIRQGYIDRREGNWSSSIANFELALKLDPHNLVFLKQLALTYSALRLYNKERKVLDRALAIVPDDPALRVQRAEVEFHARGETEPMRKAIEAVLAKDPAAQKTLGDLAYQVALCEGDAVRAERALALMTPSDAHEESGPYPKEWCEGLIARLRNDPVTAQAAFRAARKELARIVDEEPNFAEGLSALGMVDAALGDKENAIREGRRGVELLPPGKDAVVSPLLLQNLALIYAWTGEKTEALRTLKKVTSMPGYLNYGLLLRHPLWSPLREEPGFQEILASLAPAPR